MAISPRWDFMEIKETFWQNIVIEEQAISVLQNKKNQQCMNEHGCSFGSGAKVKTESVTQDLIFVSGWHSTKKRILCTKLC